MVRGSNLRLIRGSNLSGANKSKESRSNKFNNRAKPNRQSKNWSHQHDNEDHSAAAYRLHTNPARS